MSDIEAICVTVVLVAFIFLLGFVFWIMEKNDE